MKTLCFKRVLLWAKPIGMGLGKRKFKFKIDWGTTIFCRLLIITAAQKVGTEYNVELI